MALAVSSACGSPTQALWRPTAQDRDYDVG
jgi:hypothetical protein